MLTTTTITQRKSNSQVSFASDAKIESNTLTHPTRAKTNKPPFTVADVRKAL